MEDSRGRYRSSLGLAATVAAAQALDRMAIGEHVLVNGKPGVVVGVEEEVVPDQPSYQHEPQGAPQGRCPGPQGRQAAHQPAYRYPDVHGGQVNVEEFIKRHGMVLVQKKEGQPADQPFRATWAEPGQKFADGCHAIGSSPDQALRRLDGYLHRNRLSNYSTDKGFRAGARCDYCEGYPPSRNCLHAASNGSTQHLPLPAEGVPAQYCRGANCGLLVGHAGHCQD